MPAKTAGWPPRWLTKTTPAERKRGDGPYAADFVNGLCRITKDSVAGPVGAPIVLRPWQTALVDALLARRRDGTYRHRQALVGMPRKNGKSALGSGLGLFGLLLGPEGGEVYSCAAEKEQARIVFGMARRMVELEPDLAEVITTYRDALEVKATGSIYRVLSAEAYSKEGLNPTLTIFDEVHAQPNRELWDVMALAGGARREPLLVGITTAGVRTDALGRDSLCYSLYQHGQRVVRGELSDPSFFFCWWEPAKAAEADHRDPKVWREANPGLGDIVALEDFESTLTRTPESEFRTKRTNVFVVGRDAALPHGSWDRIADPSRSPDGKPVVVFVDGSWSGDSTGMVGCTLEDRPHLFVVDAWERPDDAIEWRVPVNDVKARAKQACLELGATEIDFDPFRWQQTMADLEDEGLPVVEYPTNAPARIVPAWKKFYDGVLDQAFTHDGDPRLARHVENMVLKIDQHGARPTKEHKASRRHIDLGICAVGAYDRATAQPDPEPAMAAPEVVLL